MSRIVRIIVWAIILFAFYFFISSVFKSCSIKKDPAPSFEKETEMVDSDYGESGDESDSEYFEDTGDDYDATDAADGESDFDDPISSSAVNSEGQNITESGREIQEDVANETENSDSDNTTDSATNEVEETTSSSSTYTSSASHSLSGKYLVVSGSFLMESNADNMISKLNKMGYDGAGKIIFEASQYYTVTAGRYSSMSDARSVEQALKSQGVDCYVHRIN